MNLPSLPEFTAGLQKLVLGHAWLRAPGSLAGEKVCVLACHSRDGRLSRHTLHLAEQWQAHGFKVLLVAAAGRRVLRLQRSPVLAAMEGAMLRRNQGYDFGSWASALQSRPDIRRAALLALTNDSVYGPLQGFDRLLELAQSTDADVIGLTDSHEVEHHIQSYLVFYRPRALASSTFERFWSTRTASRREDVILQSEVPLMKVMRQGGLRVHTLFPVPTTDPLNPTLRRWRELLEAGFPFIKVQLLRDSFRGQPIEGWEQLMADRGFDPSIVHEHLGVRTA